MKFFPRLVAALLLFFGVTAGAQAKWPDVFNPFQVITLNFELNPADWDRIRHDTNYYDPSTNVRVPCLMWADGETNQLTVQIRRKSDPALPSESTPQKVSLKIDINEYVTGQEWRGLKKLSLENGGGNGVVHEAFAMNLHRLASEAGLYPYDAGYASWIRVVVNGQYVGLYANPEDRDKQFLRNRGMYKPGAVWLYESNPGAVLDTTVATTNSPTWSKLCYSPLDSRCTAPTTPSAALALERDFLAYIDMNGMLAQGAIEAFTGNGDGLFTHTGKNSFFVDLIPTNQFKRYYFPWDLDTGVSGNASDTTFNIYSGGPGNKPDSRKYQTEILGHYWFRQQYRHVMTDLLDGPLSNASLTDFLNQLESVLAPYLAEDPNANSDFGSLRTWVTNRIANVRTQVGAITGWPDFSQRGGEIVSGFPLSLSHTNASGVIYYTTDGTDPRGLGGITNGILYSTPLTLNDTAHIMARVKSGTNWSALRQATFNVAGHGNALRITEIMYNPLPDGGNDDASEFEFIELKNTGVTPVDLSGCSFDGIDFKFAPKTTVPPGGFIVLVRNPVYFAQRYPGVTFHGVYFGGVSATGERIRLKNSDGNNIVSVEFDNDSPWPLGANGLGYSLVNHNVNGDPDNGENWRTSTNIHGSPGSDDPAPPYSVGVVVNEVLAHTDTPFEDAIELHNTTGSDINIGGWYLSDRLAKTNTNWASLKKYKIPAGTIVPARGYKVFYEESFNPVSPGSNALVPFAFGKFGEEVYLSSADAGGNLTGHIVGFEFGASDNPVTYGRYQTSVGADLTFFEAMSFGVNNPTSKSNFRTGAGVTNSAPKIGPVVINEIMYNPTNGGNEFVELYNLTGASIDLGGWVLSGANLTFATNTVISPNGFLILVGTTNVTAAQFRATHNVPVAVPILTHAFDLQNDGERLALSKVNDDPLGPPVLVDRVRYNDKAPWPTEADGEGPSLERSSPTVYGNDPLNWRTTMAGPSPGRGNAITNGIAISKQSSWNALGAGWNLGSAWRNVDYSDNGWTDGDGPLGYGEPFILTTLTNASITRPITTYFRKTFAITENPAAIVQLVMSANYDDGFVAWLNGQEVARRSMPGGSVTASTLASTHLATGYETIDLSAHINKLVRGRNILAVEVHQASANNTKLVWDASLTYSLIVEPAPLDTDNDGMPDTWEDQYSLNKNSSADAGLDADNDGMSNLSEYLAGTNPNDPNSNLQIIFAETNGVGGFIVRWSSVTGKSYVLQQSTNLTSWDDVSGPVPANGALTETTTPAASTRLFYRVLLAQ